MKKKSTLLLLALAAFTQWAPVNAQFTDVIKGVFHDMRTNNNDDPWESIGSVFEKDGVYTIDYMYGQEGWKYVNYLTIPKGGVMSMEWDGSVLSDAVQDPSFAKSEIVNGDNTVNWEKAQTAINLINMSANSGALYIDGQIVTVMSRDYQSTEDNELFVVRKWDAKTCTMKSKQHYPVSANLESAGMAYNPKDGKVYGLFHFTDTPLNTAITTDEDYYTDEDDADSGREGLDDGYAIGTIDLSTMTVTQITPGLYYGNFVTFAINSEGRAFALTSGGSRAAEGADGKMRDLDNNLSGATLIEFDLATGLMKETKHYGTGYASKVKRQAACFAKSDPTKMYWVGYYNSGKGINDYGSWGELSDKEWKTNHKYDTCLYEVDITTGEGTRLWNINNRYIFSALWIDGDDNSDGAGIDVTGIQEVKGNTAKTTDGAYYDLQGRRVAQPTHGMYIINGRKVVIK